MMVSLSDPPKHYNMPTSQYTLRPVTLRQSQFRSSFLVRLQLERTAQPVCESTRRPRNDSSAEPPTPGLTPFGALLRAGQIIWNVSRRWYCTRLGLFPRIQELATNLQRVHPAHPSEETQAMPTEWVRWWAWGESNSRPTV
jgi:hypothetical protein